MGGRKKGNMKSGESKEGKKIIRINRNKINLKRKL
jgi:hypothetical protein